MDSEELQKSGKKKTVISISIGSSQRDATGSILLGDTQVLLERKGTDGDMDEAARLLQFYDGKVDAMGLGGTDLYLVAGDRQYVFAESAKLLKKIKDTPVLDGSGLKNTLERMAIRYLANTRVIDFNGKNVLLVCAVDRFGMAEALTEQKCRVLFGDIIYGLGCNVPIRSLTALRRWAAVLVPIITRLPIKWMYPTGKKQDSHIVRNPEYFLNSDIIAGDFLFIKRFMPSRLEGKTIITNTVTEEDRQMLKGAGVKMLVTTTPCLKGRSFGTNVLEAAIVAASGSKKALKPEAYEAFIKKYNIMPSIECFH